MAYISGIFDGFFKAGLVPLIKEGSVLNHNKGHSGRIKSKRTPNVMSKVKDVIERDASKSTRKIAQEVSASHTTVRKKSELKTLT